VGGFPSCTITASLLFEPSIGDSFTGSELKEKTARILASLK
jgi:hypothetical protein